MYKNIKSFFSTLLSDAEGQTGEDKQHSVELIMAALMAGSLTAVATAATLLARPALIELGKQLPLPTIDSIIGGN